MDKLHCNNCGGENKINAKYCSQCGYEIPRPDKGSEERNPSGAKKEAGNKKKQLLGSIVGMVAFALAYFAVQQRFFKPPSYDKIMMLEASELNKTCPIMVDQFTRLDNAVALPNKTFQYNYTLIGIDKSQLNPDTLKKYMEPGILNNIKTNPDLKMQREHKTTMIYYYKDEKGVFVHKFIITPDMYK
jgi:ribosomal protein L40E